MRSFVLGVAMLAIASPVFAINIAWVTFHGSDDTGNTPSTAAAGAGFTVAPDKGYTDLLTGAGHMINRITVPAPAGNAALPAATLAELNSADLVIIGRSVNSGSFDNAAEQSSWNTSITKPMIITSGYITRGSRMAYTTGETIPDITGPTRFLAANPAHPLFQGVPLDASNETSTILDVLTVPINGMPTLQRGTSINSSPLVAGATVLASITSDNPAAANAPIIAEWSAGATSNRGETFGSKRMIFFTGSRETDGISGDTAGILDLSTDGQQLFLNAVCYMAGGGCGPPLVAGDTNGDGQVTIADFAPIQANFRKSVTGRSQGDLVPNGVVDFDDFHQWKAAFLGGGGSLAGLDLSFASNVPEPSTFGLAFFAVLGAIARAFRRRVAN